MNWKEIHDNYPKALEELKKWRDWLRYHVENEDVGHYYTDGVHIVQNWKALPTRDLYDFFDMRDINVGIIFHHAVGIEKWFAFTITHDGGNSHEEFGMKSELQRNAVEVAAFTEAFKILNTRL